MPICAIISSVDVWDLGLDGVKFPRTPVLCDIKGSILFLNYTRYNFSHGKVSYSLFSFVVGLLLYFHSSCLWLMSVTGNLVLVWIPFVLLRCSLLTTWSVRLSMRRVSI